MFIVLLVFCFHAMACFIIICVFLETDRQIRLYRADKGTLKPINQIQARDVGWSVIDVAFSPDCSKFVYSSWSSACKLYYLFILMYNAAIMNICFSTFMFHQR